MKNQQDIDIKSKKIEDLLIETINLLEDIHYLDLEKSLKIITQRNYKQYPIVKNKVGDVIMRIYNTSIYNEKEIVNKLDEIYKILKENE